jgi:hypothetical protein
MASRAGTAVATGKLVGTLYSLSKLAKLRPTVLGSRMRPSAIAPSGISTVW